MGEPKKKGKKSSEQRRQAPFRPCYISEAGGLPSSLQNSHLVFAMLCRWIYYLNLFFFFFFPLLKVMMTICSYRSILCMTQNSPYMGTYCTSTVESLYYIFVPCQLCYQCKINGFWHTAAQHVNSGSNTAVKGFVYWYTRIWWQR